MPNSSVATMNSNLRLKFIRLAIVTCALLHLLVPPALAQPNLSNQEMQQPAQLIAPDPDFKIKVYPQPSDRKRQVGYGLGGDTVQVQEQVGSNEGYTWDYVRFDKSPHLEGWIRGDYVQFQIEQTSKLNAGNRQVDQSQPFQRQQFQTNNWDNQRQNANDQSSDQGWH
jgi:hypothetical protein